MMKQRKILFLDVDGVLNNLLFYELCRAIDYGTKLNSIDVDVRNVFVLAKMVEWLKPNVGIVLSSSWRCSEAYMSDLQRKLNEFNIPKFEGITPMLNDEQLSCEQLREKEILTYMKAHHLKKENIAVLDDLPLCELADRQLLTTFFDGLTYQYFEQLKELFKQS